MASATTNGRAIIATTILLTLAVMVLPARTARAGAAATPCVSPITACGCTITQPGFYTLANDLDASQGLTAKGACIDIKASKVTLNTGQPGHQRNNGFNITGPGGATPAGIGIHVLKGSNNNLLELLTALSGWDVGLKIEGDNNIAEDFEAGKFNAMSGNGTAGVEIAGGKNNNLNDFSADHNQNYGVWVHGGAKNNQFNCANSRFNGGVGVFVGCAADGSVGNNCTPKGVPSNGNKLYDYSSFKNAGKGVVIDVGNTGTLVANVSANLNGGTDLDDENPNCSGNLWFLNIFDTSSQNCIDARTPPGIGSMAKAQTRQCRRSAPPA